MIWNLIYIRLKQIYREVSSINLIRMLVLLALLAYVMLIINKMAVNHPAYLASAILFLVLLLQLNRKDKLFLKTQIENYKIALFAEYCFLSAPVLVMLLFRKQWIPVLIIFTGVYIITYIDYKIRKANLNTPLQKLIPDESYEWKAGFRQSFFLIITVWTIALATSFYVGTVPIAMFILGIIPFSFYEKGEPYNLIIASELNSKQFLIRKITVLILLYSIIILPLIAAYMLFHYKMWYLPVIEYFIFVTLYVYVIVTKYAFYEPCKKLGTAMTYGSLGIISAIVVILLPLVWALSAWFFIKSKHKLNYYLNDFN